MKVRFKSADEFIEAILAIDPDAEINNDEDNGQFMVLFNYAEDPNTGEFVELEVSIDDDSEEEEATNEEELG